MSSPYDQIRIEGDPTVWTLAAAIDPAEIAASAAPLELGVTSPLQGTLLLSGTAVASVTLSSSRSGNPSFLRPMGWIPGNEAQKNPFLYLPKASSATAGPAYYQLSAETLAGLKNEITAAMANGTKITVPIDSGTSAVVLNGAALPFAVVGP